MGGRNAPGTKKTHSRGYIVYSGKGTWEYEHRLVMERHLNRPLTVHEWVRHRNGNLFDNRLSNLQLLEVGRKRENPWVNCACGCGLRRRQYDRSGRIRRFILGHAMRVRTRRKRS